MEQWGSVDEIMEFAITREQEAVDFYTDLAEQATSDQMRSVFEGFANEERGHKRKLEDIQTGERMLPVARDVLDLKIADYLVEVEPQPDLSYQDALIIAMKKEKAAFKLYTDLAAAVGDAELTNIFESLALEEAKHKLRFELEYDTHFRTDW